MFRRYRCDQRNIRPQVSAKIHHLAWMINAQFLDNDIDIRWTIDAAMRCPKNT